MTFCHAPFWCQRSFYSAAGLQPCILRRKRKMFCATGFHWVCTSLLWKDISVHTHANDLKRLNKSFTSYIVNDGIQLFQLGCLKWNVPINVRPLIAWFLGTQNTHVLPLQPGTTQGREPCSHHPECHSGNGSNPAAHYFGHMCDYSQDRRKNMKFAIWLGSHSQKNPVYKHLVRHYLLCGSGNWSGKKKIRH